MICVITPSPLCAPREQTKEATAVDTEGEMKQAAAELREEAGLPPASTSAAPAEQKDVELVSRIASGCSGIHEM